MSAGGCQSCGVKLGERNRSGFCRRCFAKAAHASGDLGKKISAGLKRKLAADPEYADELRKRALKAGRSEGADKARRERWHREKIWLAGNRAATNPESRAKAARSCSDTRLAWCPPHLRKDYLALIYSKRLKADEARQMIEEQHGAEMARFRRKYVEPGVFVA